ncbi:MCE family protein [Mycobacterium pyrenivorans]|nr:MCE family protein [Mycolicibacterium pyrenivorans]
MTLSSVKSPLIGFLAVLGLIMVVVLAVFSFRGAFHSTVPVMVVSQRAGLLMNPDAKVKMRGVQVGKVASIEDRPDGMAIIHLALDSAQVGMIPSNVRVDVASSTVFGAKFVELIPPRTLSMDTISADAVIQADHVTVEINTVFQQLSSVIATIEPVKLNQVLGTLSSALNGRGEQLGQTLSDFNDTLARLDPSLDNLAQDIRTAPAALNSFADAAPDLVTVLKNVTDLSGTVVGQEQNLDAFLFSAIGLGNVGTDVLGSNRERLTTVLDLLAPVTDLTNEYNQAIYCGLGGTVYMSKGSPSRVPGIELLIGLTPGAERYRYPSNVPKVSAQGGPQCTGMPVVGFEKRPPFVVADTGATPWPYGNQNVLLNSDGLKQHLFGPIDGPPRNTAQIGQPG